MPFVILTLSFSVSIYMCTLCVTFSFMQVSAYLQACIFVLQNLEFNGVTMAL